MPADKKEVIRILVADDEQICLDLYQKILTKKKKEDAFAVELDALEKELFGSGMINPYKDAEYELVLCSQGDEAVAAAKEALHTDRPFALAFLDVRMPPGPDGVETAEKIRGIDPFIQIAIVTGYSDIDPDEIARRIQPPDRLLYIQKPFHPHEVRQFVSTLSARWKTEKILIDMNSRLEQTVGNRTAELRKTNEDLKKEVLTRKQAEEEMRKSKESLQVILDHLPFGLMMIAMDKTVRHVNGPALELMGYASQEEIVGKPCHQTICPADENDCPIIDNNQSLDKSERYLLTKKGKHIPIIKSVIPITMDNEQVLLEVFVDITRLKKAEEEKRKLEAQVLHAQKLESLGVLAGGIAHDFNNIIMTIMGNTDLALMDIPTASPVRECINEIQVAGQRAAELSRQMLAYSGKGSFLKELVNLSELVSEMARLLSVSVSKKVTFKKILAEKLPVIEGDSSQLRQVVMNLITNASEAVLDKEYGQNDGPLIQVETGMMSADDNYIKGLTLVKHELKAGDYVYLRVTDNGCGMNEETRKKLFEPFFTTKFTGRGLGMASVLGIIQGHHGAIKVESELGKGTTFTVFFPFLDRRTRTRAAEEEPEMEWGMEGSGTILIIDDEESVLNVCRRMLEKMGFKVITAPDGRQGAAIFKKDPENINCVILDMTMPYMDGKSTFRELRKIRDDIHVIIASGYHETEIAESFPDETGINFISKPFQLSSLREKLR
jgi:PAS domain S-box-containing protein